MPEKRNAQPRTACEMRKRPKLSLAREVSGVDELQAAAERPTSTALDPSTSTAIYPSFRRVAIKKEKPSEAGCSRDEQLYSVVEDVNAFEEPINYQNFETPKDSKMGIPLTALEAARCKNDFSEKSTTDNPTPGSCSTDVASSSIGIKKEVSDSDTEFLDIKTEPVEWGPQTQTPKDSKIGLPLTALETARCTNDFSEKSTTDNSTRTRDSCSTDVISSNIEIKKEVSESDAEFIDIKEEPVDWSPQTQYQSEDDEVGCYSTQAEIARKPFEIHRACTAVLAVVLNKLKVEKKEALPPIESASAKGHIGEPLEDKEVDHHVQECEGNHGIQSLSSGASSSRSTSSSSSSSSSSDNELDQDDLYIPDYEEETDTSDDDSAVLDKTPKAIGEIGMSKSAPILVSPSKKKVKKSASPENCRRNVQKCLGNEGKACEVKPKFQNNRAKRRMKLPCHDNCKLKCSKKFTKEERSGICTSYWNLKKRKRHEFIRNSIEVVEIMNRYLGIDGTELSKRLKSAFYLGKNDKRIRVCRVFFKNTLDINNEDIRSVFEENDLVAVVLKEEDRGIKKRMHDNHCTVYNRIREKITRYIESIPKIESYFTRSNTTRTFIDRSKTFAEIHRDYVANCKEEGLPFTNYSRFCTIVTQELNISRFSPKKGQCDTCTLYGNAGKTEKELLKESYVSHQNEKELSRKEKAFDKRTSDSVVAVYAWQPVMQLPKGDLSVFYYKSKLNVLNFTIYDIKTNKCDCFIWDESNGHCGVNELGTCVLKYIKSVAESGKKDIIFYSDDCGGQQKNEFMLALYLYAVKELDVNSITHKYLIEGHTQNEGDAAQYLIEEQTKRLLKSEPIYTPENFVTAIRSAKKKGDPFKVSHLGFDDFYNIKSIADNICPMNLEYLRMSEIKVLKVTKESPSTVFYKRSYADEFKRCTVLEQCKMEKDFRLLPCFKEKPGIPQKKKDDLMELCEKKFIPKYHHKFYEGL